MGFTHLTPSMLAQREGARRRQPHLLHAHRESREGRRDHQLSLIVKVMMVNNDQPTVKAPDQFQSPAGRTHSWNGAAVLCQWKGCLQPGCSWATRRVPLWPYSRTSPLLFSTM